MDYRADYNQMGIFGDTLMINGVVRPYVDVTTQKVRLLFLGGSNRREWRLHFDDDLVMTQIAGYDSFLPHPIKMTKLLVTPGERLQVVVDFSQYHDGDVVNLYTDDFKLIEFRIHKFEADNSEIPDTLFTPEVPKVDPSFPVRKVTMDGCDKMNGKRFAMQRIDMKQKVGQAEYWDVTNTNSKKEGMIHPFHIHGTHFLVVSRNGKSHIQTKLVFTRIKFPLHQEKLCAYWLNSHLRESSCIEELSQNMFGCPVWIPKDMVRKPKQLMLLVVLVKKRILQMHRLVQVSIKNSVVMSEE